MAIRYPIALSTTDPNNAIGLLKIRQADEQTQTLVVQITESGIPKNYEGLQPFFCAKLGQSPGLGIIEQKLNADEMTNPKSGLLEYTMRAEDWQKIGQQTGYFSFRKMKNDGHEYTEQFSTRDFYYTVTKSVFSDGLTEVKKDGSTYVWTIEDLIRLLEEYIASGQSDWEQFVEQNRGILESVDPGGAILSYLGNMKRFREWDTDLILKMRNEFTERAINAGWWKTGNIIQLAVDEAVRTNTKQVIVPNMKIEHFQGVKIPECNGLEIIGLNTTLEADTAIVYFEPTGSVSNLTISGFRATNTLASTSAAVDFPTFFGSSSSEDFEFDNILIEDNYLENVKNGISLNANLSGHVHNSVIRRNVIKKTHGTDPGAGYAIHLANGDNETYSNNQIYANVIEESSRHAIYCARGNGTKIFRNLIRNHRIVDQRMVTNSAIPIARSRNVDCYENIIINSYSVGISVNPETEETDTIYDSRNITIRRNEIYSTRMAAIQVGLDGVGVGDKSGINGVYVDDNVIYQNNATLITAESMGFKNYNCKNLYVRRNQIYLDNSTIATNYGLQLGVVSEGDATTQPLHSFNWNYEENNIRFEAPETARGAIRINNVKDTRVDMIFNKNKKSTVLPMFSMSGEATNPNIEILGESTGMIFASGNNARESEFQRVASRKLELAGTYQNPIKMGDNYLWFANDGKLVRKNGSPPNGQADGTVLG
ncbi:BppU family phage baseplate upper protein [Enterococcus pseudoavium]|uniref:BppU family phage baseplate upper protein n=1 Tax=Enterococcus pseudoavium TaxID=44007 RepID=A0AAE4I1E5_9ENTE|nr:BppU family phage baseplate upper protein [Enterococcus pseudoavium]MDT2737694.1 BppU family phage baseplate upper protein [Enterococcus pseudoavium]